MRKHSSNREEQRKQSERAIKERQESTGGNKLRPHLTADSLQTKYMILDLWFIFYFLSPDQMQQLTLMYRGRKIHHQELDVQM